MVHLTLWWKERSAARDLQNIPGPEEEIPELGYNPFPLMVWMFSLSFLVLLDGFYLIESIVHNFAIRSAENPKAQALVTIGTSVGVLMAIGIMIPLESKLHVFEGKHWAYRILYAELGALLGARLIGYSKWFAKIYEYGQPSLPGYSKINGELQV